jgi:hypothetical protein
LSGFSTINYAKQWVFSIICSHTRNQFKVLDCFCVHHHCSCLQLSANHHFLPLFPLLTFTLILPVEPVYTTCKLFAANSIVWAKLICLNNAAALAKAKYLMWNCYNTSIIINIIWLHTLLLLQIQLLKSFRVTHIASSKRFL